MMKINRIRTQGSGKSYYIKTYRLLYSDTGIGFKAYTMKNSTIMVCTANFLLMSILICRHVNLPER